MQSIIIGKEGNQPFKIKAEGVSREHARMTIDEHDHWTLEDMNSSNGTYIRRESDGELVRVGKVEITPMTFICLGPDNSKGCSFYARQLLHANYDRYDEEYEYLQAVTERMDARLQKVDKKMKMMRIWLLVFNVVIVGISFIGSIKGDDGEPLVDNFTNLMFMRTIPIISAVVGVMYDGNSKKRRIESERERFSHCPNPLCYHKLRASDIRNYCCPRCKK